MASLGKHVVALQHKPWAGGYLLQRSIGRAGRAPYSALSKISQVSLITETGCVSEAGWLHSKPIKASLHDRCKEQSVGQWSVCAVITI